MAYAAIIIINSNIGQMLDEANDKAVEAPLDGVTAKDVELQDFKQDENGNEIGANDNQVDPNRGLPNIPIEPTVTQQEEPQKRDGVQFAPLQRNLHEDKTAVRKVDNQSTRGQPSARSGGDTDTTRLSVNRGGLSARSGGANQSASATGAASPSASDAKKALKKKKLLAYENRPRCCTQLRDQLTMQCKPVCRGSFCLLIMLIAVPLGLIGQFIFIKSRTNDKTYPDFTVDFLKHPNYQTAYLDLETDEFGANFNTIRDQQMEFESFMQFNNYTNVNRVTSEVVLNEEGLEEKVKVRSYMPTMDTLSPHTWVVPQCESSVDYKYDSPVVGIIRHGTQLEQDLWTQLQPVAGDTAAIQDFYAELEKFYAKVSLLGGEDEDPAATGEGTDLESGEPAAEAVEEEEPAVDPLAWVLDPTLLNEAGGGPPSPNEIVIEKIGDYKFKEFGSQEELFDYVQQEGYGWDEDKPAVCMAFEVHENEDKTKYELELYFREQWPAMYMSTIRSDVDPFEPRNEVDLIRYTRTAYSGLNMMQVFAANSLLQRRLGPEAEIVLFTLPFDSKLYKTSPWHISIQSYTSQFMFLTILPFVLYFANGIAREKETKLKGVLLSNGLGPCTHFFAWLLQYTFFCLIVSFVYALLMSSIVFVDDSFTLVFYAAFASIESFFGLLWALQPFFRSSKLALFLTIFFLAASYVFGMATDQKQPVLDQQVKTLAAISPMTAVKQTWDTMAQWQSMEYPTTWENAGTKKYNWSVELGIQMLWFDFFAFMVLGWVLEIAKNFGLYFKTCFHRAVRFRNTSEGVLEVKGLKEWGQKKGPSYDFKVQKSTICCLIGNKSVQKTNLLEMLAGRRACAGGGSMLLKDSDFFVRGSFPSLSEFLVYRPSELALNESMTAVDHLTLFAHLRGNQKSANTRILCDKLLPNDLLVQYYSESQKQCLQTLIALASENSRILLLDEPTRGLGPQQRSELIKAIWKFKRDRYVIIQSSDAELVNVLADSVGRLSDEGIEIMEEADTEAKLGSYKLVVQVEFGRPNDNLVRYLAKDVPELTLEYHSDLLTYYVLPNISKALLLKKTRFMEQHKQMLGLLNFEVISLPPFEVAQRNIHADVPVELHSQFEESLAEQEYGEEQDPESVDANNNNKPEPSEKRSLFPAELMHSDREEESDAIVEEIRLPNIINQQPNQEDQGLPPIGKPNNQVRRESKAQADNDPEMEAFMEIAGEPLQKPIYHRELFYDFKKFRAKRRTCCVQCWHICCRHTKEHRNNKLRYCTLQLLPAALCAFAYLCSRYMLIKQVPSQLTTPENFIMPKSPILVNSKTQVGGHDTSKYIEGLPKSDEFFVPKYIDTSAHEDSYEFKKELFTWSTEEVEEMPWAFGAYQFYEMDDERHKYKINSYVNMSHPMSTQVFPQFVIESVLKNALQEPDFELKLRTTPMPIPQEVAEKNPFFRSLDFLRVNVQIAMSNVVGEWVAYAADGVSSILLAMVCLNAVTLSQVVRERTSSRKHFSEHLGQSKLAYWVARYVHDLVFYVPMTFVAVYMIDNYDAEMTYGKIATFHYPFVVLPFLYIWSQIFHREASAVVTFVFFQLIMIWIFPGVLTIARMNPSTEELGDFLFNFFRTQPLAALGTAYQGNSVILGNVQRFREQNDQGVGPDLITDDSDPSNGPADIFWLRLQIFVYWLILIVIIEYELFCVCCFPASRMRRVTKRDNNEFFGKRNEFEFDEEEGESSEVAQVVGDGEQLELRFGVKQKPNRELAYKITDMSLTRRGGLCCGERQYLISDLCAQIQAGSKFAIVSDGGQGGTSILSTLSDRNTAYKVSGLLKKQLGRGEPVYTTQNSDVLFEELSLEDNLKFYEGLGSVHPRFTAQMLVAFGLYERRHILVRSLTVSERHITQLILALASSNRTVILDEPFTGLTHEQTLKLVKIIRQKHDCTVIVTAKSKVQIELFQPHSVLTIRKQAELYSHQQHSSFGYLISLRLKALETAGVGKESVQSLGLMKQATSAVSLNGMNNVDLATFLQKNFAIFEKLRGRKRNLVVSAITKVMKKARMSPEIAEEIAEMVYEDMELQMSNEELALKCQLIRSLFAIVEALCRRFGEVHLEQRQDDYAVLRVIYNDTARVKGVDDSFTDQNPVFSSVVEYLSENEQVRRGAYSCQFLSSRHSLQPAGDDRGRPLVKIFRFQAKTGKIERANPYQSTASMVSLPNLSLPQ